MSLRERIKSFNKDMPDIIIVPSPDMAIMYNFGITEYREDVCYIGEMFELKPKIIEAIKATFKHIKNKIELTEEMVGLIAYLDGVTHATARNYQLKTLNSLMENYLNIAKDNITIQLTSLINTTAFGLMQDGYLPGTGEASIAINKNALERWS